MIAAIWLPLILIALGVGFVGGHEVGYAKGRKDEREKIDQWLSRRDRYTECQIHGTDLQFDCGWCQTAAGRSLEQ